MTKKHFNRIAAIMRDSQPTANEEAFQLWRAACVEFADLCTASNPRFKRQTFLDACGYC